LPLRVTLMVVLLGHYIPQGLPPLRLLEEMEKRLVVVQALVQVLVQALVQVLVQALVQVLVRVQAHSALVGQRVY
jgi:hypothetical protein